MRWRLAFLGALLLPDLALDPFHGGLTARMPDGPSTMTSRVSAAVGPTRAMRRRPASTCALTHSAPLRVLPKPRPARSIQ